MNQLYASAVGTTVLQIREVPLRPAELDGVLCIFGPGEGVDEGAVRLALRHFGEIVAVVDRRIPPLERDEIAVHFTSHQAVLHAIKMFTEAKLEAAEREIEVAADRETAQKARDEARKARDEARMTWNKASRELTDRQAALDAIVVHPMLAISCKGMGAMYTDRPYDERGWCCSEDSISSELTARLNVYPKMAAALRGLKPKMYALSSDAPPTPIEKQVEASEEHVEHSLERIEVATFTGKADRPIVKQLYIIYLAKLAYVLQKTLVLHLALSEGGGAPQLSIPPAPSIIVEGPRPWRLADGQPVLMLTEGGRPGSHGEGGSTRFGIVAGGRVRCTLAGSDAALSFDGCSQVVLPWCRPREGWEAALQTDVEVLASLDERVRQMEVEVRALVGAAVSPATAPALEGRVRSVVAEVASVGEVARSRPCIEAFATEAARDIRSAADSVLATLTHPSAAASEPQSLDVLPLLAELARLRPEALAAAALRASGGMGSRSYLPGQWLTVRVAGRWVDAEVAEGGLLTLDDGRVEEMLLHPWNHASRELARSAFETVRSWWVGVLRAQHSHIADALSGKQLDVLSQCVPIEVHASTGELSHVKDAFVLGSWLAALRARCVQGRDVDTSPTALLEGPPASGKTSLISQVVMHTLLMAELVPIPIKVQELQRQLLESPGAFTACWNWIDAYLRLEHAEPVYRMLRQAMAARRAILLLDGLDEGGVKRDEIERHVAEVLAPQGHVMLVTSRPAGLDKARRFAGFRQLKLAPLTEAQQAKALEERLGADQAAKLLPYLDRLPRYDIDDAGRKDTSGERSRGDEGSGLAVSAIRVTSNPLMLSMIASVFEIRQGIEMPSTVAELYAIASDAMLARGGAASDELRTLLQCIFFEAHVAQRRVIEDRQLDEAALGLTDPESLKAIRERAPKELRATLDREPLALYVGRAELGQYVEVVAGKHADKRGIITSDDKSAFPYKVTFANGVESDWLKLDELKSSGLDETALLSRAMAACAEEVRAACEMKLPETMREALAEVRRRVASDQLPLLSLLQAEPLQMQSSHLSFQEYFAARALCEEGAILSGAPPWQWPAWWANAVTLGAEMGDKFRRGLLRAAGVTDDTLDLSRKLGGDRPTVLRVVIELSAVLTSLDISENYIGPQLGIIMAEMLKKNTSITSLDLSDNYLDAEAGKALAEALQSGITTLNKLDTRRNNIFGDAAQQLSSAVLASASIEVFSDVPIKELRADSLTELNLAVKGLGPTEAKVLAALIEGSSSLKSIDISSNYLTGWRGDDMSGIQALADALKSGSTSLTVIDLRSNDIDHTTEDILRRAVDGRTVTVDLKL